MNLETRLEPRLWKATRESLEARNFTGAIQDAIHFLSDLIRERAGLEGDGVALVGEAFGGASPKLKVNRLQTESEQSVQRGVESMLRGIYQAIRNPRSHGKHQDDERDAIAIILFLDYLIRIVDQSRTPFSLPAFVQRVLDPDFVPKKRYADLLVKEIPEKKRLATSLEVFSRRAEGDGRKLRFFFDSILDIMTEEDRKELYTVISEELRQTDDEGTVRFVLQVFPSKIWKDIDEVARLRIENKLIGSIKEGRWIREQNRCRGGALGTWSTSILEHFTLKDDLWAAVFDKLGSSDKSEQDYALSYFLRYASSAFNTPPHRLVSLMNRGLRDGNIHFKEAVEMWTWNGWEESESDNPWKEPFKAALEAFQEAEPTIDNFDDDLPF